MREENVIEIIVFSFHFGFFGYQECVTARARSPGIDGFTSPPNDAVKLKLTWCVCVLTCVEEGSGCKTDIFVCMSTIIC